MSDIVVRTVDPESRDIGDWIGVPKTVHADDRSFVIQPDKLERQRVTRAHNPYLKTIEAAFFIAYRGGQPVGRISVQFDRRLVDAEGQPVGHFGFADFIENQAVADLLVARARAWLGQAGAHTMRGPFNLSINQECGCLVEGFDSPPAVMMPHARRWIGPMLEQAGLAKAMDMFAYRVDPKSVPERFLKFCRWQVTSHAIVVRPLDLANLTREIELMGEIFNDGWRDNWGFVPFSRAELHHLAAEFKPVLRQDYGLFVEIAGRPVAIMIAIPNLNEMFASMQGRLGLLNSLRLLWALHRERWHTARVPILGVRKEVQGGALGAAVVASMMEKLLERSRKFHLDWVEFSWVLENNLPARRVLEEAGGARVKTYRIYSGPTA
ncbi:dATP pyrophosphohydrolase [Phreatobacter sp.]|uniref:dATP pyrophosphohydrolase n=1 Tax=Phreatobacter sp. TaxID=1966341 RepID=UPI003F6FEBC4